MGWAGLKRALPVALTLVLTGALQAIGALEARSAPRRLGVWLTNSPSPLYYDANRIDRAEIGRAHV